MTNTNRGGNKMIVRFDGDKFSQTLRNYRGNKSQGDVAKELKTNRTTISLLENNKQIPTLEILKKCCEMTNSTIDSFFIKEDNDPIMMMMGQVKHSDKQNLLNVLERIKIREKYIAIAKRCGI